MEEQLHQRVGIFSTLPTRMNVTILETSLGDRKMHIGTWNVEYAYESRLDALRDVLAKNKADVRVLTETHNDLAPVGCPNPLHSEDRPKNWRGMRPGSKKVSIWSKFPITKEERMPLADPTRTVCGILDLGKGRTILVYGTVLPWKGDGGGFTWSEHHRVIPEQCAEWLKLRELYPDADLCFAGDFNTDMCTGSYYGTKRGIEALNSGLNAKGYDSFCATIQERFPIERRLQFPLIDHIALPLKYKNSTSIAEAWPANKKVLSDHSGVIVEISI